MPLTQDECWPSRVVYYTPSPGHRFYGTVAAEPWELGCGVWVTKLINMESAYAKWSRKTGDKASTVYGAALDRLEPCDHPVAELKGDSDDLSEFIDQLTALCKAAGHSGQYGDNPIGMVTDIINERDALRDVLRRSILPNDVPADMLEGNVSYSSLRESAREFLQ